MVNAPKVVKALGIAWVAAASVLILLGLIGLAMTDGVMAALEILSPFNFINYAAIAITLMPGILAIVWANKRLGI